MKERVPYYRTVVPRLDHQGHLNQGQEYRGTTAKVRIIGRYVATAYIKEGDVGPDNDSPHEPLTFDTPGGSLAYLTQYEPTIGLWPYSLGVSWTYNHRSRG